MKNMDMCKRSKRREKRAVDHGGKGSRERRSHFNVVCYSDLSMLKVFACVHIIRNRNGKNQQKNKILKGSNVRHHKVITVMHILKIWAPPMGKTKV